MAHPNSEFSSLAKELFDQHVFTNSPVDDSKIELLSGLLETDDKGLSAIISLGGWFYDVDRYAEAKLCFEIGAAAGSDECHFGMGCLYRDGSGVSQDSVEAVRWYTKIYSKDDPMDGYFYFWGDFPTSHKTNEWENSELLVELLEQATPGQVKEIFELVPNAGDLVKQVWVEKTEQ